MYKGKLIEVRRNFNMLDMAQDDPEVVSWFGQSYRAVGPYYENKSAASGLTFDEQRLLLPEIIGIEPQDREFRKAVIDFYHAFSTKVPSQGVKLQVSLNDDTQNLSQDNMPINVKDYISWRHMRNHPEVAIDKSEADRIFNKRFYIHDPEGITKEALLVNELEDRAFGVYSKFKDDTIKVDQILTMMAIDIRSMKDDQKILKFKSLAQKDAKLNDRDQKDKFNKFVITAEDRDLEYKYLVQEMISAQYLKTVGNNILYTESGSKVGDNMEDAVLYFKNAKNSRELNLLRAEYQIKVKKGAAYLPKEIATPIVEKVKTV